VLLALVPILRETGVGSDVMKPIAAPIVGGMITSTIHVLILAPVFFVMIKEHAFRRQTRQENKELARGLSGRVPALFEDRWRIAALRCPP